MRNHLDGGAEIVAAPLALDDVLVDAAVVMLSPWFADPPCEALVVPEIQVGLGTVIGDEHFAVLIRRHRPRIDVQIGIELLDPGAISTRLEQRRESGCSDAFSKGGDHAAGDEYVSRHGSHRLALVARFRQRKCGAIAVIPRSSHHRRPSMK